jgi:hypothetical protein
VLSTRTNWAVTRARLRRIQGKSSCKLYNDLCLPVDRESSGSKKVTAAFAGAKIPAPHGGFRKQMNAVCLLVRAAPKGDWARGFARMPARGSRTPSRGTTHGYLEPLLMPFVRERACEIGSAQRANAEHRRFDRWSGVSGCRVVAQRPSLSLGVIGVHIVAGVSDVPSSRDKVASRDRAWPDPAQWWPRER